MARYEIGDVKTRGIWEHKDGERRHIAIDLGNYDGPRLCTLLNMTCKDAAGLGRAFKRTLSGEELENLRDNAIAELAARAQRRRENPHEDDPALYTDNDTINATAPPVCCGCTHPVADPANVVRAPDGSGRVLCSGCFVSALGGGTHGD
jgi:hypothetical protein